MQAVSYLGAPAFDSSGKVIGHLAVVDNKSMEEDPRFGRLLWRAARSNGRLLLKARIITCDHAGQTNKDATIFRCSGSIPMLFVGNCAFLLR